MIISIKSKDEKFNRVFRLGEFKKIVLETNVGYYMKIYSSQRENYDFVIACEKLEKDIKDYVYIDDVDSIAILEFKQIRENSPVLNEKLRSKGARSLVAQIYFKPQNFNPNSKILRWPIRIYNKNGFLVKRIPIIVKSTFWRLFFFALYCSGIVVLTDVYSDFSHYLLNEEILPLSCGIYAKVLFQKWISVFIGIWLSIRGYDWLRRGFEKSSFH